MKRWIELRGMAAEVQPGIANTKLSTLAEYFLGGFLDKDGQTGDYSENPLPLNLQKYAALDALVHRKLYEILFSKLKRPQSSLVYEEPDGLQIDGKVELYLGGSSVANCKIIYISSCQVQFGFCTLLLFKLRGQNQRQLNLTFYTFL